MGVRYPSTTSFIMARRPTHSEVARFISSLLPPKQNDVPLHYHVPQNPSYNFEVSPTDQVVLSVTPSPNVYDIIGADGARGTRGQRQGSEGSEERGPHTIAFLHRPFALDRNRVRDDLLVLASHTSFDEHLTVGWNPALARRLGIDMAKTLCVRGYKGDPDRKIGTIASVNMILGPLLRSIEYEFGAIDHAQEGMSEEIKLIAIMNAFSSDEVHRVLDLAQEYGWVPDAQNSGQHVLYLTGEPRKSGLEAAKQRGMTVVCVGKTSAEQWGITYMAARLRGTFPTLDVKEIYEDRLDAPRDDQTTDTTTESSDG